MNIIPRESGGSPSKVKGDEARVFTEKGWAQIEGNVAFQNQRPRIPKSTWRMVRMVLLIALFQRNHQPNQVFTDFAN